MVFFQKIFKSTGNRLHGYDYTQNGKYFITIEEKNMEHIFGKIINRELILNEYGKIVEECWFDLPNHYENLILDEFCIMPNHVHMIMIIKNIDGVKKHGISEFVRAVKTFSSRKINEARNTPGKKNWKVDFWDEIIRTDERYYEIKEYIRNNPKNWRV
ncbi:MAG TPA: transposase [Bacteroidales bacterium]|nr:transposase [Bacteroidales bacterium]